MAERSGSDDANRKGRLMPFYLFDIETSVDPAMPAYKPEDPAAFPPPPYWRVEIVGGLSLRDDFTAVRLATLDGEDEVARVGRLVDILDGEHRPIAVSYGGRNFDVPVVTGAAMRAGIQFPGRFRRMSKRFDSDHVDVNDHLGDFGACRSVGGLEAWALSLGWPGKLEGIHGSDVATLIAHGQRDAAEAYCLVDCCLLAGVFLRLTLTRGMLDGDGYLRAVDALLEVIGRDPRLAQWLHRVDLERVRKIAPSKAAVPPADAPASSPATEAA
jgi:predicted PolB exonuclease-like 3'-5' exonuclease